jgi:hypothetical protein
LNIHTKKGSWKMSERMLEELREYIAVKEIVQRLAAYVGEDSGETPEIILEAVEEKLDENQYILNTIHDYCEGCEGRKDGFTCPAKSFLDMEVLNR